MPYKDPEKRRSQFGKLYFPAISVRFRKGEDDVLYDSLLNASKATGIASYVRSAISEKLFRDGYPIAAQPELQHPENETDSDGDEGHAG